MNRTLNTLTFLAIMQFLPACSEQVARPPESGNIMISAAHSVYIEGGVLKMLSDNEQNILFVYVRPEVIDHWVATGGGGGAQDKPWLFKSAASWTLGDDNGEYSSDAPKKSFNFLFNGQDMSLTVDRGTYAVRRGDFIVISLDSSWHTSAVKSGMEALRRFDMPEDEKKRLLTAARKHYTDR